MEKSFLDWHKESCEHGFWDETYLSSLIFNTERMYKKEIIMEWGISKLIIDGDKVLVKWFKRMFPLSEEDYNKKYT